MTTHTSTHSPSTSACMAPYPLAAIRAAILRDAQWRRCGIWSRRLRCPLLC